ncbi:hypothetical protein MMC24_001024 [Lignoscripta atroalba]|nr:hypothetical protein [Lignoscripta atroalba]
MPRNRGFVPLHEPLRNHNALQLQYERTTGPLSFLNPTHAHYRHRDLADAPAKVVTESSLRTTANHTFSGEERGALQDKDEKVFSNVEYKWRSRDNRKGRHTLLVEPCDDHSNDQFIAPARTSTLRAAGQGIQRMLTQYPYWDPGTEFHNEILVGGGVTAFIGATIFEVGSVLLMIEAVNENRAGCFGWALERALESGGKIRLRPDGDGCRHHHTNKKNLVGKSDVKSTSTTSSASSDSYAVDQTEKSSGSSSEEGNTWIWFPSTHDLTTHYFRELGFLASLAQLFGASVFWISGFTALPGLNNKMSQGLLDGIYWTPQIVGGTGFIISGVLFMLETQPKWYLPAPTVLGWHIGLWNLIGALGFTLCGALGPAYANSGAQYEAGLATFWGSWAFLIGSVIQWYESLDKHPVEEKGKDERAM